MTVRERYLVTGGAGFIGRHLCRALLAAGHFVRVIDDLSRGQEEAGLPDGCEWIRGSVVDEVLCREACEGIDGVFHLAAAIGTPPNVEPVDYFMHQNVRGTQNVLLAARDAHVKKLVYSASRTAYGAQAPPHTVDVTPDCLTPYALSKLVGEQLCALFTRLYGLPTVSLRYADVYGPGQPASGPYATVIARLLEQRRRGRPLCAEAGGARERDFVHVCDVVEANRRAYQASASGVTLNVGSGRLHSVKAVADWIASGGAGRPGYGGAPDPTGASVEETRERIGWAPCIPLEKGLRDLVTGEGHSSEVG